MTIGTIFCNQCGAQNPTTAQFCSNCGAALGSSLPASNRVSAGTAAMTTPVLSQSIQDAVGPPNMAVSTVRYGGFWIRFVAALIDGLIVQAVVMPVGLALGIAAGIASATVNGTGQSLHLTSFIILAAFGGFASWIYEAAMESSSRQATLGKMIFGMKVTDLRGHRVSFARATARHFSKIISGMILFLGYIMAGFTAQKQALHDMIAGTVVRRG
jgi:uncharacterized RDD family membrane protein YckC